MKHHKQFHRGLELLAGAVLIMAGLPAWVLAEQDSEALKQGIRLYEEASYRAAQEVLLKVNREALNEAEKSLRDEYVERIQLAVTMVDKATDDLEKAESDLKAGKPDSAEPLFQAVLDNEFAPQPLKKSAADGLTAVARKRRESPKVHTEVEEATPAPQAPVGVQDSASKTTTEHQAATRETTSITEYEVSTESTGPSPAEEARNLTEQGYDAMKAGRDDKARQSFTHALQVLPGYPEAVAGLEELDLRAQVESESSTLISRLREREQVNWQRTVAGYRDAERQVRDLVMEEKFPQARLALLRARQIVESGKQFADPVSKYEALLGEFEALERYTAEEEQRFNESRVRAIRQEVQTTENARQQEVQDARRRQMDALMDQALQLRKEGDFEGAIQSLEQVVAIEPTNQQALTLLDVFQDAHALTQQGRFRTDRDREVQRTLTDVEEDKIPWYEELRFPKNWPEIISRSDTRTASGLERMSTEDLVLKSKLDEKYAVNFQDQPFEEVIQKLKDDRGININVIWNDVEGLGIERETPVTLTLKDVPVRHALDAILDSVEVGDVDLAYATQGGIIKIASRPTLDRDVFSAVYDVRDLLQPVNNFSDGPQINLAKQKAGEAGGSGGNIRSSTGQIFGDDDDEEEEKEQNEERSRRVDQLVNLIQDSVQRDSWCERGGGRATIAEFNGELVVTQTASAHGEIRDLLSQLRDQAAIQVAVEAIFLQINSNYLEELGLDMDVVLNQGNAGYDQLGTVDSVTGSQLLLPRSNGRTGFIPGVPGVGVPLTQTGFSDSGGTIGVPPQPYNNPVLVPTRGSRFIDSSRTSPVPIQSNVINLVSPQPTDVEGSFGGSDLQPAINIFGSFLDNLQVDFLLRATQADRRSSVLSAPRITLTNGQRSWVGVVTQQAYVSTLQPVLDENAAAVQPIIGVIETGTVLDVQATVSADKHFVTLILRPGVGRLVGDVEVFEFGLAAGQAGSAGFIQVPTVQRQILKTTVTVPDGGTLLFGGLKLAAEVELEAGVPILSKIPVLKQLYSSRSLVKDESVLLILVKPKIIILREAQEEAFPSLAGR